MTDMSKVIAVLKEARRELSWSRQSYISGILVKIDAILVDAEIAALSAALGEMP